MIIRVSDTTGSGLSENITVADDTTVEQLSALRHGQDWEERVVPHVNSQQVDGDTVLKANDHVSYSLRKNVGY